MSEETLIESTSSELPVGKVKVKGVPETTTNNVIGSSGTTRKGGKKGGAIVVDEESNILSSKAAAKKPKQGTPKAETIEKTAIYSAKNITVEGLGAVAKGYNIVPTSIVNEWLAKSYIREATPEEVANQYQG